MITLDFDQKRGIFRYKGKDGAFLGEEDYSFTQKLRKKWALNGKTTPGGLPVTELAQIMAKLLD